eukprot:COSAG02_NODE_12349_length_1559_cov_1.469863_1_plen_501_part_10
MEYYGAVLLMDVSDPQRPVVVSETTDKTLQQDEHRGISRLILLYARTITTVHINGSSGSGIYALVAGAQDPTGPYPPYCIAHSSTYLVDPDRTNGNGVQLIDISNLSSPFGLNLQAQDGVGGADGTGFGFDVRNGADDIITFESKDKDDSYDGKRTYAVVVTVQSSPSGPPWYNQGQLQLVDICADCYDRPSSYSTDSHNSQRFPRGSIAQLQCNPGFVVDSRLHGSHVEPSIRCYRKGEGHHPLMAYRGMYEKFRAIWTPADGCSSSDGPVDCLTREPLSHVDEANQVSAQLKWLIPPDLAVPCVKVENECKVRGTVIDSPYKFKFLSTTDRSNRKLTTSQRLHWNYSLPNISALKQTYGTMALYGTWTGWYYDSPLATTPTGSLMDWTVLAQFCIGCANALIWALCLQNLLVFSHRETSIAWRQQHCCRGVAPVLSMSGLFTSFCSLFLLDLSRLDQPFEKPDGTKLVVSGTMQALDLNLADDFHYWLQGIVYGMACGA